MIRYTSLYVSTVLAVTLLSCTQWGANHGGSGDGTNSMSEPLGTTQISIGEIPTTSGPPDSVTGMSSSAGSETQLSNDTSEVSASSSTTGDATEGRTTGQMMQTSTGEGADPDTDGTTGSLPPSPACLPDEMVYLMDNVPVPRGKVRLVFVTSWQYYGDLNNQFGGPDGICMASASLAPNDFKLPGVFKAWISTATDWPANPMGGFEQYDETFTYVKYDVNNPEYVIPVSNGGLVLGTLLSVIDVHEFAGTVDKSRSVWTGTNPMGMATGYNCENWTKGLAANQCDGGMLTGPTGTIGRTDEVGPAWTERPHNLECLDNPNNPFDLNRNRCDLPHRVYCVQQC